MVMFEESAAGVADHFFVKEDPARIYRGLKRMLEEEFDVDRITEEEMEFNVEKPKDRVRAFAFKEKSPHTVIRFKFSFKASTPKGVYMMDREDQDLYFARPSISASVITVYPGGDPISWLPRGPQEFHVERKGQTQLKAEERSRFQKSKLYEILVGIWYHKFYSKTVEKYKEEASESVYRMQNLMRERFGVEKAVSKSGASHYNPPWK